MKINRNLNISIKLSTWLLMAVFALSSCDSVIYDDEGNCDVSYMLRFRYDMNLKWANAFANEVKSVKLCAYDMQGKLVWEKCEKGGQLAEDDYKMKLDLPAGEYKLIAWCGIDNDAHLDGRMESFSVSQTSVGVSSHSELTCNLNTNSDSEHPSYSDEHLYSLFHGSIDVNLPTSDDGEVFLYDMPLTKDTNHVRIILQHLGQEDVNVDDFTFHIEDANGNLAHDNSVMPGSTVRYRTWKTQNGVAGVGKEDLPETKGISYVNGAIADMTVGRMVTEHKNDMMLTITNRFGEKVAKVPVIHYALLAKDYYEQAYKKKMSDQEFLDREDEYTLTFFLDDQGRWINSSIMIHSWKVVLDEVDL